MAKTMFITGASTGIGHATALHFAKKGWNVAATMRKPENETELTQSPNVKLYKLDVTDTASIEAARDQAIADFGTIDVVVNNAGYAVSGIFENMTEEQIKRQYDVNVFGLMRVTKAFLPHFRANKAGTFVNLSSVGGILATPTLEVYQSTKFAVEGLSEGWYNELKPLGIRVVIIEPGSIGTDFQGRSQDKTPNTIEDYNPILEKMGKVAAGRQTQYLEPTVIAELIDTALSDDSGRARYASADAEPMIKMRNEKGADAFMQMLGQMTMGE